VGSWLAPQYSDLRVPRIEEPFQQMRGKPGRMMYLDVKNIDLAQLAQMVKSLDIESQVILASTKYDQLRTWKKLAPRSQTLHWMGGTQQALDKRFYDLQSTNYDGVTQLQVHCVMKLPMEQIRRQTVDPFALSDEFLIRVGEEMRGRGILYQTLPWGGATPEVYFKLLDLGAMSFATDHPQVTLDAVHRYFKLDDEGKRS
jgi:hypothetical protein